MILFSSVVALMTVSVGTTYAHVVVKPAEVGVGAFQTFSMGVPNEKDNPTVALTLTIPGGLNYVSPNVKPGWDIEIKKNGEGENAKVTEITWTGGAIPAAQRDDFVFSAQAPTEETTLKWKATQTYEDGETVSWTHEPSKDHAENAPPPYSTTKVINDLKKDSETEQTKVEDDEELMQWLPAVSGLSLILSVIAIGMQLRRRK